MDVIIPALHPDTVAGRALQCEGVRDSAIMVFGNDLDYGHLLAALWRDGRGFIVLEDDMAPWPGAIDQLRTCPEPWCRFDYSIGFGRFGSGTLGCMKFGPDLLAAHPGLGDAWAGVHWRNLDATVVHAIAKVSPELPYALQQPTPDTDSYLAKCHVHTPAIAHAKHYRGAA